ncbi:E1-E2 ATPase-domain-containing protein [Pelagophyceae sp. CCMP2097]|nr:E1-E2 ATPase-domain-containing protein [Pelagophyceae sp. CCMP2097]
MCQLAPCHCPIAPGAAPDAGAEECELPVARLCGLCQLAPCHCPELEIALSTEVSPSVVAAVLAGFPAGSVRQQGRTVAFTLPEADFTKRTVDGIVAALGALCPGASAKLVFRDADGAVVDMESPGGAPAATRRAKPAAHLDAGAVVNDAPVARAEARCRAPSGVAAGAASAAAAASDKASEAAPEKAVRSRLKVANMCCELETALIKSKLLPLPGVVAVATNIVGRVCYVTHLPSQVTALELCEALNEVHLGASLQAAAQADDAAEDRISAGEAGFGAALVAGFAVGVGGASSAAHSVAAHHAAGRVLGPFAWVLVAVTVIGALPIIRRAYRSITARRQLDVNCLMLTAVAGALALREFVEAAAVVVVFVFAELVENECMRRVRNALRNVGAADTDEKWATKKFLNAAGKAADQRIETSALAIGDVISSRAGERVPVDGVVVSGKAAVDESALTGEALAVEKVSGSTVSAGTLVANGYLEIRVTAAAGDSSTASLRRMVDEAQASTSKTQEVVTEFAGYFTPAALFAAVLVIVVPLIINPRRGDISDWVQSALILLVVACPCALVLAAPIATVSAIGAAAQRGVLVKSAAALESLAAVDTLATDKTGTLTQGRCRVVDRLDLDDEDAGDVALRLAASLETRSTHPLATAIVNLAVGCVGEIDDDSKLSTDVRDFKIVAGCGISGTVDGRDVAVGNAAFCGVVPSVARAAVRAGATSIFVAIDGDASLALMIADPLRVEAAAALRLVAQLRGAAGGAFELAMLTGDAQATADAVADELRAQLAAPAPPGALDLNVHAELHPADKLAWVRAAQARGRVVLMVGDGVNDAPALAAADVGAAMGAGGTAMAVHAADVAIMTDDLLRLYDALILARFTTRVIRQNVFFAVAVKVTIVVLAFTTGAKLWMAIIADVGSLVLVLANGLRPLKFFPDAAKTADDDEDDALPPDEKV